jgi:hypothetical protein
MQELVESRANPTTTNADVQWGPVIAGALAGTAVASVLMGFAAALGLLVASPSPSWRDTSVWLTLLSGVWMLLVYVFSFGLAGYVAGRMRSPFTGADPNEIEFRDGMHGLLAWALGVIIGALLLWATITAVASTRTGVTAGEAAGASELAYLAFELDRLFRSDGRPADPNQQASRAEAGRIIRTGLGRRDLAGEDRAYLVGLVAARTGLSPQDAERRVAQVMESARTAANRARRSGVIVGFMTATALLAGAAAAWLAGLAGGRHRDDEAIPSLSSMTWQSLRASGRLN